MSVYKQIRRNRVKTYLVVLIFVGVITAFFYLLGKYLNNPALYFTLGLGLSLVSGLGGYLYSDKIVLSMTGAKPAHKKEYFDYYTVAENMAIAAGLPKPKLYVIEDKAANAFATGRDPKHAVVVATTGLLSRLERAEIEGVIAHELSHIKNYDILLMSIITVLVGTIAFVSTWTMRIFWWRGDNRSRGSRTSPIYFILFLIFIILTPIVATLIQLAISRRREFLADASAVLLTRYPKGLASALEKISVDKNTLKSASNATAHLFIANPLKKGKEFFNSITTLFSTHPPIEERIRTLQKM